MISSMDFLCYRNNFGFNKKKIDILKKNRKILVFFLNKDILESKQELIASNSYFHLSLEIIVLFTL